MRNHSPSAGTQQKWTRSNEGYRIRSPCSKDEDLALFHDMRVRENKNFLHPSTDDIETSLSTKLGGLTGFRIAASSTTPSWKANDLLASADSDKTDYDWLLTPPGTPLFPSLDKDSLQTYMDRNITVAQSHSASKGTRFSGSNATEMHRMSRRSPGPRTPTSTVSSTSSSHTFSRGRAPSPSRGAPSPARGAPSPSRGGSSPTLRPSAPLKTLTRSTTIMNRASTRSSPPVLRRTNTSPSLRSSSTERNVLHSKGRSSVSPKLQAWQAPELGFSAEPPPNLRTSLSDRPLSGSRNGAARPRIGVQEARHHLESRHSYSEAIDTRHSHWRNSSSSASKLSSSTTSQDRWSSRGSVISSSDDGMDAIEPTFLDFSAATSPSSISGTSKLLAGKFNNEVSSRYSPVVNRQKKSASSTRETASFSASARKSLEPSMQRVDHRRVSQNMFRPLLSSAPATSFCNIGHTLARHRPANAFAEPSMTASSNASSEKGTRIFPGNETSEEEGEAESEWDKSMPAASAMSKLVLDEKDPRDETYDRVHDHRDQYERESVADNASCTMDGCETERANNLNSLDWEMIQTTGEVYSEEEDPNGFMAMPSIKRIIHTSIDEDVVCVNTQEANADNNFKDSQDDIQKRPTCFYCDSLHMSCYGQQVGAEVSDGSVNYSQLCKTEDENSQEATVISRIEIACSPERLRSIRNCNDAEQKQCIGMNQPALESISSGYISPPTPCHESHSDSLHSELPKSVQGAPLKSNTHFPETENGTKPVVQDDSSQDKQESPVKNLLSSEKAHALNCTPASFASIVAGISALEDVERVSCSRHVIENFSTSSASIVMGNTVLRHAEKEDCFQPESPITGGLQELQGLSSNFPSTTRSEMPSDLYQSMLTSKASGCELDIDTVEIKESIESRGESCNNVMKPENQLLTEDERAVDSEKCTGANQTEYSQAGSDAHSMNLYSEDIRLHNGMLSLHGCNQASLAMEEEKNCDGNAPADVSPSSPSWQESPNKQLQNNEHWAIDPESSTVLGGEIPSEGCLATEVSEEGEPSESADNSTSACSQDIPQSPNELQPCSSSELNLRHTDLPEEAAAVSASITEADGIIQINLLDPTESQNQPQTGSPLKTNPSSGQRSATHSFSFEEATNTILFCSSIVHDMVYKAASVAAAKEAEALKARAPLLPASRGQNTNADFISSLRGKVSKSVPWKVRQKETKASPKDLQKEEVLEVPLTIAKSPIPIERMDRDPTKCEAENTLPDTTKEKSFMGMTVNPNCQCIIM